MAANQGLKKWLWKQRASTRVAYLLQLVVRVLGSLMGMVWYRVLAGVMGKPQYGLFLAFQSVISFGGQGDLGVGSAVGIRVGQYFGQGKEKEGELHRFLATARTVFLLLGIAAGVGMLVLSPWLSHWFLPSEPQAGSRTLLFVVGSVAFAGAIFFSYLSNLNYACGNVTWPILPSFVLLQFCMIAHWLLARQRMPLWIQYLPYVLLTLSSLWLTYFFVRTSHRALAGLRPLLFDRRLAGALFENSFWIYLCTLGNLLYKNTDNLVIGQGMKFGKFEAGSLVDYIGNYRFCDVALFLVIVAGYVSLPKITQWMASADPHDQERARREMRRLNQFQTLLGCGAALAYLAGNNLFIKIWMWHEKTPVLPMAITLQIAFALNLAISASGDAGIQLAIRSGNRGLRTAGTAVALTGLLNLGLSIVAMRMSSFWGVAMATAVAQSVFSLVANFYTCRHLQVSWVPWVFKGWLIPSLGIYLAGWLRILWPMDSLTHVSLLVIAYLAMFLLAAWGLGINAQLIKDELKILRGMFGK